MDITLAEDEKLFTVEFPPLFTSDLENITIDNANYNSSFTYTFPTIVDINNDDYTMDLINLPDFIEYNENDLTLSYDSKSSLTIDDYGNYTVNIQLTDDKSYQSTYEIIIEIFDSEAEDE